jgi:transposase
MGKGEDLSDYERGKIDAMIDLGLSYVEICRKLDRSASTISKYARKSDKTSLKHNSGRVSGVSDRLKRRIFHLATKKTMSTREIMLALPEKLSQSTVARVLKDNYNAKYVKFKCCPPLLPRHIKQRLTWSEKVQTWTHEWDHIIFSDEKKWNLDGPDGISYYWHDIRHEQRYLSRRVGKGGSVMVWGAFTSTSKSTLAFISNKMNSIAYQEMLESHLLPFINELNDENISFQQDNAPIHVSGSTKEWFDNQNIDLLDWPAISPDLNPIENIWGLITRVVYKDGQQYRNKDDLTNAIVRAWDGLPLDTLQNLIKSMETRVLQLIKAGGRKTNY